MSKKFYVVNAGRFGGTSRATHIIQSNDSSTPDPMSPGSIIAQLIWFGGNAKTTLCGLQATRHVNVFDPSEVSCRECKKRYLAWRKPVMDALDEVEGALAELQVSVDGMVADRDAKQARIDRIVEEHDARERRENPGRFDADGRDICERWITEGVPEEDRLIDFVFDPETQTSRIVYGIRGES